MCQNEAEAWDRHITLLYSPYTSSWKTGFIAFEGHTPVVIILILLTIDTTSLSLDGCRLTGWKAMYCHWHRFLVKLNKVLILLTLWKSLFYWNFRYDLKIRDPKSFKSASEIKQNGTQEQTPPFSESLFHALSHGMVQLMKTSIGCLLQMTKILWRSLIVKSQPNRIELVPKPG